MTQLIVLTGAGASFDCVGDELLVLDAGLRPPLVHGLFSPHRQFANVLGHYPGAQQAAPSIRDAVLGGTLALEDFLRDRLRDGDQYARRRYWSIPLYLQELLMTISREYTREADNYSRLVNETLGIGETLYVTLNYDTLLDSILSVYRPLTSELAYVGEDWSLIKLHGSADWSRRVLGNIDAAVVADDEHMARTLDSLGEPELADEIEVRQQGSLRRRRYDDQGPVLYYPALAVPLGPADDLVCPRRHVDHLRTRLAARHGLHILVIGYSGLDAQVLTLLAQSGNTLRTLLVVNGPAHDEHQHPAHEAAARICSSLNYNAGQPTEPMLYLGGFDDFVRSGALAEHVRLVQGVDARAL